MTRTSADADAAAAAAAAAGAAAWRAGPHPLKKYGGPACWPACEEPLFLWSVRWPVLMLRRGSVGSEGTAFPYPYHLSETDSSPCILPCPVPCILPSTGSVHCIPPCIPLPSAIPSISL